MRKGTDWRSEPVSLVFMWYAQDTVGTVTSLECVGVPADSAAQGELLPGGRVGHVEGALVTVQLPQLGPYRALGQGVLGHVGHPLEVVVASVAKMGVSEAKEDGDRAAVAALVFQVVGAVLETHLGAGHVRTAAAHQLLRVVVVTQTGVGVALSQPAVVSFAALETHVVGVPATNNMTRLFRKTLSLGFRLLFTP